MTVHKINSVAGLLGVDHRIHELETHCHDRLAEVRIEGKERKRLINTVRKIIVMGKKGKRSDNDLAHRMFTRRMQPNAWSSQFDEQTTPVNQPLDKALFERVREIINIKHHWCAGYLIALALLDLFKVYRSMPVSDIPGMAAYAGTDAPGHEGENFMMQQEEHDILAANMIGKAEEAVFKADAYWEAAQRGGEGQTPPNTRWIPHAVDALRRYGPVFVNQHRTAKGKIIKSSLCEALKTRYRAEEHTQELPSIRTMTKYIEAVVEEAQSGSTPLVLN